MYRSWDIAPIWFVLSALCVWALHRWSPGIQLWNYPWTLAAVPIVTSGLLLLFWAVRRFRREDTAIRPFAPATALVREGPYRFTRNPMYLGLVTTLAGGAVALGSATCWLLPLGFALMLHRRFVVREEAFLTRCFGDAYRDFCRDVRRWL